MLILKVYSINNKNPYFKLLNLITLTYLFHFGGKLWQVIFLKNLVFNCSLLVCGNMLDFYVFTMYLVTLLNLLMVLVPGVLFLFYLGFSCCLWIGSVFISSFFFFLRVIGPGLLEWCRIGVVKKHSYLVSQLSGRAQSFSPL